MERVVVVEIEFDLTPLKDAETDHSAVCDAVWLSSSEYVIDTESVALVVWVRRREMVHDVCADPDNDCERVDVRLSETSKENDLESVTVASTLMLPVSFMVGDTVGLRERLEPELDEYVGDAESDVLWDTSNDWVLVPVDVIDSFVVGELVGLC